MILLRVVLLLGVMGVRLAVVMVGMGVRVARLDAGDGRVCVDPGTDDTA